MERFENLERRFDRRDGSFLPSTLLRTADSDADAGVPAEGGGLRRVEKERASNKDAAKKSREKKKIYVEELESICERKCSEVHLTRTFTLDAAVVADAILHTACMCIDERGGQ